MQDFVRSLGGMGASSRNTRNFRNNTDEFFEQALLPSGDAEPRDHGLERRTILEWGHGGHRVGPVFFEV